MPVRPTSSRTPTWPAASSRWNCAGSCGSSQRYRPGARCARIDGPTSTPALSSPTIAGMPIRFASLPSRSASRSSTPICSRKTRSWCEGSGATGPAARASISARHQIPVDGLRVFEDLVHSRNAGQHGREINLPRPQPLRVESLLGFVPVIFLVLCAVVEETDEIEQGVQEVTVVPLVPGENALLRGRVAQDGVDRGGEAVRPAQGQADAGRQERVDEGGRVADQRPAGTVEPAAGVRPILDAAETTHPECPGGERLDLLGLAQLRREELLQGLARLLVLIDRRDIPDAHGVVGQRDEPEPARRPVFRHGVAEPGSAVPPAALEVGPDRDVAQIVVPLDKVEAPGQHVELPRGVDQQLAFRGPLLAVALLRVRDPDNPVPVEERFADRRLLDDIGAEFPCPREEDGVEVGAPDLVGVFVVRRLGEAEIPGSLTLAPQQGSAVFLGETHRVQPFAEPKFLQRGHRPCDQRFADVVTRELLAFKHQYAMASFRQQSGGAGTARPATDHDNVEIVLRADHSFSSVLIKLSPFAQAKGQRLVPGLVGGGGVGGGEVGVEGGDGGGVEEGADGEVGAEVGLDAGDEPHGEQGLAAEVEEAVVDADGGDAEDVGEDGGEGVLAGGGGGAVGGGGGGGGWGQ